MIRVAIDLDLGGRGTDVRRRGTRARGDYLARARRAGGRRTYRRALDAVAAQDRLP